MGLETLLGQCILLFIEQPFLLSFWQLLVGIWRHFSVSSTRLQCLQRLWRQLCTSPWGTGKFGPPPRACTLRANVFWGHSTLPYSQILYLANRCSRVSCSIMRCHAMSCNVMQDLASSLLQILQQPFLLIKLEMSCGTTESPAKVYLEPLLACGIP